MSDRIAVLAERVIAKAGRRNLTVATAESCTAGTLATLLADAPGAGDRFHGGFVVYTKESKVATLGVPPELIAAHTAVSQPVGQAMATGALERCPADIAIAITRVAGPDPDGPWASCISQLRRGTRIFAAKPTPLATCRVRR